MYASNLYTQNPAQGLVGEMLQGISWASTIPGYTRMTAAVAYATVSGARELVKELGKASGWDSVSKRWLISIDFGHTEPAALAFLASLKASEVRVPNGRAVVWRSRFSPISSFHPKLYVFDGHGAVLRKSNFGVFVGSANLSLSGLKNGCEAGRGERWLSPIAPTDVRQLQRTRRQLRSVETSWASADRLVDVLADYTSERKLRPRSVWVPKEEKTEANDLYEPPSAAEVEGESAVLLRNAAALWVETWELYHNLGVGRPGNQLDLQRGTRVFFGLSSTAVPRNTIIGPVAMEFPGFSLVTKNLRFGDNMMDKLNLPVPGTQGPAAGYNHTYLLFERLIGRAAVNRDLFRLLRLTAAQLQRRRKAASSERRFKMGGGREYGLFF